MSSPEPLPFLAQDEYQQSHGSHGHHDCATDPDLCWPDPARIRERVLSKFVPPKYQGFALTHPVALEWLADPKRRTLFISGRVGTGKSTLAYSIVETLLLRCAVNRDRWLPNSSHISVMNLPQYFAANQSASMREEQPVPRVVSDPGSCQLVFLDDLMPYKTTDTRDAALGTMIDDLYTYQVPLIITSNFGLDQLADQFGERIASRLTEGTVMITMTGSDRRSEPHAR
jgi:DNA replication protein DnaC